MQNTQFGLKIKYAIIFVLCSCLCGKHTSTKDMRIRKMPIKEKIIMKRKKKVCLESSVQLSIQ